MVRGRYLSPKQAAKTYDRVGRLQDTQGFYERPAVDTLVKAGRFDEAEHVLEIGCGTGALAARLLADGLPSTASYTGLDVSPRMVEICRTRLEPWVGRARAERVDGRSRWHIPEGSVDRVVASYVLDLLAPEALAGFVAEAARVLRPGGLVAVASLTPGRTTATRLISNVWTAAWRLSPHLTGGCRPIDASTALQAGWNVEQLEAAQQLRHQLTSAGRESRPGSITELSLIALARVAEQSATEPSPTRRSRVGCGRLRCREGRTAVVSGCRHRLACEATSLRAGERPGHRLSEGKLRVGNETVGV